MPQDGSNNYQYPPGTPGIPDTTIESEAYNTFLDDLVINDLNIPRPIHRGGTNATTAHQALINLKGEEAMQQVTNYDTYPFVSGSFYSTGVATSEPVAGQPSSGICYVYGDPAFVTLEARAVAGPDTRKYVRQKTSGTWGAWVAQAGTSANLDAAYVNVSGDTMTGSLTLTAPAQLKINDPVGTNINTIYGTKLNKNRWGIYPGDGTAESGLQVGSDFRIGRFNDAGDTLLGYPLVITRSTGLVTVGSLSVTGKGSIFGTTGGATWTSPISATDANILLYNGGGNNFAGIGADGAGNVWIRAATSGTPAAALAVEASSQTVYGTISLSSPKGVFSRPLGTPAWNDSPLVADTGVSGVWPVAVRGNDRGTLHLNVAASGYYAYFTQGLLSNTVGAISGTTTSVTYTTTSDGRKKPLRETFNGLDIINRLNPVYHNWSNEPDKWDYGVIAQEAVEVLPQMISRGDDDTNKKSGDEGFAAWGADYSKAVPVLMRAVQELAAQNAELKARLDVLEGGVAELSK